MELIFLFLLSIIPGIFLLFVILYMDRNEREPMHLIIITFFLGVLSTIPALIVQLILSIIPIFSIPGIIGAFFSSFIQVAPIEELAKLSVVLIFIFPNKHFNEENDGIVYVSTSALGFAVFENIFYVFGHGFEVGILRAVTAIPIHCFTGVIMGYFVGLAKFAPQPRRTTLILKGYFLAYFIHASYNTLCLSGTYLALLIFPVVLGTIVSGILLLRNGRKLSLQRWQNTIPISPPKPPNRWKIYISRTLFILIIIFWVLLFYGYSLDPQESLLSIILGGMILSFFPFCISIVLEVSYYFDRQKT